jgi:hypothetical protein
MRRILRILLPVVAFMMFAPALHAQNAVLLGTVYDKKGDPAPGITVLVENKQTGFSRVTTTAADGTYSVPEVPPADGYVVTASKEGEEWSQRAGISVNVGDERSILPPLREPQPAAAPGETPQPGQPAPGQPAGGNPGQPAGPVHNPTVRAETTQTSIGGVITGEQLRTLPLYNRNFLVLGLLTPNVHDVEASSPLAGASFSIAGSRPSSNVFLLDGFDNQATISNQAIPFQVNDAIQEFRVTSVTANAEYGRNAGGVVSVVTRRGTNQWHGSGFGYFANDYFNSNNPISDYVNSGFANAAIYAGPTNSAAVLPTGTSLNLVPLNYNQYVATAKAKGFCTNSLTVAAFASPSTCAGTANGANTVFDPDSILAANNNFKQQFDSKQFGANIAGAVVKDRYWIYLGYEGTRINNPNAVFERVPSSFDKTFRNPNVAAGNYLGGNYTTAQKILSLFPASNVSAVPGVLEFYQGFAPNYTNVHNVLLRNDFKINDKNTFNLRYAGQLLDQLHDATMPPNGSYPGNGSNRKVQNQNVMLSFNHNFTQKLINDMRIGVVQFRVGDHAQDNSFNATTLGLPNAAMPTILLNGLDTQYSGASPTKSGAFAGWYDAFWSPTAGSNTRIQIPSLDSLFPFARLGAPLGSPNYNRDSTWSFNDNLNWNHGKHAFKFGFEYHLISDLVDNGSFTRGLVYSGNIGEFTSDSETCNVALNGAVPCNQAFRAPSFDYALNQQPNYKGLFQSHNFGGFAQDSWRIHRKVTVNMGIRYEYFGVPVESNNQIWNFDPAANGLVQQGGTAVFDPFGYKCGVPVGTQFLDFLTRSGGNAQLGWSCAASKNGNIIHPDYGDFAPRAGIAWDVHGNGRTVVRAGVGIFYDQLPIGDTSQLLLNRPTALNLASPRYVYGQNFFGNYFLSPGNKCLQCGFGNTTIVPANLNQLNQSAASPNVLYARDYQHSRSPYSRQATVTLQQQLGDHAVAEVGYIANASRRLPIVHNANYNDEWFCNSTRVPQTGTLATTPYCDTFSYFPVIQMSNQAQSSYQSLMARLRINQFHGFRVNATYTFSKSRDNDSSATYPLVPTPLFTQAFGLQFYGLGNPLGLFLSQGGSFFNQLPPTSPISPLPQFPSYNQSVNTTGASSIVTTPYLLPQDPNNYLTNEQGPSDFDARHRIVSDFTYELPFNKQNWWLNNIAISGILVARSGQPYSIFSGSVYGEVTQRINVPTGGVSLTTNPNSMIAINGTTSLSTFTAAQLKALLPAITCNYATPATGGTLYNGTVGTACIGSSGRNAFIGPNYASLDAAIQKSFKVKGEGRELTIRAEVFNLFNRANYYNPNSTLSLDGYNANPNFGKVQSAHAARQMQFGARYTF